MACVVVVVVVVVVVHLCQSLHHWVGIALDLATELCDSLGSILPYMQEINVMYWTGCCSNNLERLSRSPHVLPCCVVGVQRLGMGRQSPLS